jgi:hypothetical protein
VRVFSHSRSSRAYSQGLFARRKACRHSSRIRHGLPFLWLRTPPSILSMFLSCLRHRPCLTARISSGLPRNLSSAPVLSL